MNTKYMIRLRRKWTRRVVVLIPGSLACSCMTDLRDSLTSGGLDFVSGSVTSLMNSALPVADFFARIAGLGFSSLGL